MIAYFSYLCEYTLYTHILWLADTREGYLDHYLPRVLIRSLHYFSGVQWQAGLVDSEHLSWQ